MSDCCDSHVSCTTPSSPVEESTETGAGLHIAIIGSGSAAFAAAIKASERGAQVTLVEGLPKIGGTCVNIGCVPSKILIRAAQLAHLQANHDFVGITHHRPQIDRAGLLRQQQARVEELRGAKYESILEANANIQLLKGWASFVDAQTLAITRPDGEIRSLTADRFLIATGARAAVPPIAGLADTPFWTSTEALLAEQAPQHLVVLGASVVALELAQAMLRLGSQVTIIARSGLLSREDPQLGEGLAEVLREEGASLLLQTVPTRVGYGDDVFIVDTAEGEIRADRLLVATGRVANTDALNAEAIGLERNDRGAIKVDDHLRSSVEHIYAAGDCSDLPQYVYVAAAAGTRAGINMTRGDARLDLAVLPTVVFTDPAVATVGLTEAEARAQGLNIESRRLDLHHVPRALANFETRGFIQLVAEQGTKQSGGRLLGAQILAAEAGEMIQTAALALAQGMTVEDLAGQLFPYLTMVEGLKLCAQTFNKDVTELSCCAG